MNKKGTPISLASKLITLLISISLALLGILAIVNNYAPGRWTRFGYAVPLFGDRANLFGVVLLLLSGIPLLLLLKSAHQAILLGTLLGLALLITIFLGVYGLS